MRIQLFSLPIDVITKDEAIARIIRFLHEDKQRHIVTLNPEMVIAAQEQPLLKGIVRRADLVVPDGIGLVWSGRIVGYRIPERVTGVRIVQDLARALSLFRMRLVLLGGRRGAAEAAALFLHDLNPDLDIIWAGEELIITDEGVVDRSSRGYWLRLKEELSCGPPTALMVAFGSPKQELWITRYLHDLPSVKVAAGIGGALDMLAGFTPQAPSALKMLGLEWTWRMFIEPKRVQRIASILRKFPPLVSEEWKNRKTKTNGHLAS